jgi:hypothetical protein
VSLVLPDALTWVLDIVGVDWPNVDEDQLRTAADELREMSQELGSDTDDAKSQIEQMLQNNSSQSLQLFEGLWNKVAGSHLPQVAQGMNVVAGALDAGAVIVVGMKVAAIAQLAILAAEIIADQVEAAFTFGASEALIPVQTIATREIMQTIEKKVVDQLEQQLIGAIEQPVIDALTNVAEDLGSQLLSDATGQSSGINLGEAASAGASGFSDGVENLASNPASALGLPTGGSSDPSSADSEDSEDSEDSGYSGDSDEDSSDSSDYESDPSAATV